MNTETKRQTTAEERAALIYLNLLRESGEVNMYGAVPYLQAEFKCDRETGRKYLKLWMDNFRSDFDYEFVKMENNGK